MGRARLSQAVHTHIPHRLFGLSPLASYYILPSDVTSDNISFALPAIPLAVFGHYVVTFLSCIWEHTYMKHGESITIVPLKSQHHDSGIVTLTRTLGCKYTWQWMYIIWTWHTMSRVSASPPFMSGQALEWHHMLLDSTFQPHSHHRFPTTTDSSWKHSDIRYRIMIYNKIVNGKARKISLKITAEEHSY